MSIEKDVEVSNRYSIDEAIAAFARSDSANTDNNQAKSTETSDKESSDAEALQVTDFEKALYDSEQEALALEFYSSPTLDYEELFYTPAAAKQEEGYEAAKFSDTNSETMTIPEAEEALRDMQFAYVLGAKDDIDYRQRRRLANRWIFDVAIMRMFEAQSFTRDVNYTEF